MGLWQEVEPYQGSRYHNCSSHLGAVRLDKALLLRYSGVLRKGTPRQLHSLQKGSPQPLTNLTAQRSVQRPSGSSPTAPNEPQNLRAIHFCGGRVDANESRALATRSGGGRNCPRFPRDDTTPQLPNNGSRLQSASAHGNSHVAKR